MTDKRPAVEAGIEEHRVKGGAGRPARRVMTLGQAAWRRAVHAVMLATEIVRVLPSPRGVVGADRERRLPHLWWRRGDVLVARHRAGRGRTGDTSRAPLVARLDARLHSPDARAGDHRPPRGMAGRSRGQGARFRLHPVPGHPVHHADRPGTVAAQHGGRCGDARATWPPGSSARTPPWPSGWRMHRRTRRCPKAFCRSVSDFPSTRSARGWRSESFASAPVPAACATSRALAWPNCRPIPDVDRLDAPTGLVRCVRR